MTDCRTEKPNPYDIYPSWRSPDGIDEFQRTLILSVFPHASQIVDADSYRPGYQHYPLRVRVRDPEGIERCCVIKVGTHIDGVQREAMVLPVLLKLGLPVPSLLAGPVVHPEYPEAGEMAVLSEVPGTPLPFIGSTLNEADLTCRLLYEAVGRLHELTDMLLSSATADDLPHRTLLDEANHIVVRGGPWFEETVFRNALDLVVSALPAVAVPLVFSNGDYNPLNFLHTGGRLSGFVDFSGACFEDPHIGFAKFVYWGSDEVGWGTGLKAGLVERYLYSRGVSRSQFAPRLALKCLWVLQRETSVAGDGDASYRESLLRVLGQSICEMA